MVYAIRRELDVSHVIVLVGPNLFGVPRVPFRRIRHSGFLFFLFVVGKHDEESQAE
jgi:hypothetical protein